MDYAAQEYSIAHLHGDRPHDVPQDADISTQIAEGRRQDAEPEAEAADICPEVQVQGATAGARHMYGCQIRQDRTSRPQEPAACNAPGMSEKILWIRFGEN